MSDHSSQQAAPDEGAASPRPRSEVDSALEELRALRERLNHGIRSEQDRLDVMVDLCEAFDELDQAMVLGADLPAAWREGRTIRTAADLDALPADAVIRTGHSNYERFLDWPGGGARWLTPGEGVAFDADEIELPALLLWHPDWSES